MKLNAICLSLCLLTPLAVSLPTRGQETPAVPSNPQVPPENASLPCGVINAHLQSFATPLKVTDPTVLAEASGGFDGFEPLTDGQTLTQSSQQGFPLNGNGAGLASTDAKCLLTYPGDKNNVYTTLHISTVIVAQSGCCGGLHPGGRASAQPEWQSNLFVPGSGKWTLKVSLKTAVTSARSGDPKPTGDCTVSIDGSPGQGLDQTTADSSLAVTYSSWSATVSPGPHVVTIQCPIFGISAFDEGQVDRHAVLIDQTFYISASKMDPTAGN